MRFIFRFSVLPLLLALFPPSSNAQVDQFGRGISPNLFGDYRPAHQRANPGAEWESIKAREQRQIDREFEQKRNRSRSYGGRIDNRDYSRSSRRNDDRMHYHSPDKNRHRYSGRIDHNTYGATTSPAPSARSRHQWVGPDYSAQQKNAWRNNRQYASPAPSSLPRAYGGNPHATKRPADNPEKYYGTRSGESLYPYGSKRNTEKPQKYYGTRSGESLYPYTTKPVKGSWAADNANNKTSDTSRQAARALYGARERDPSYGGNKTWGASRETRVDTRSYYQDEISKYRREHKPPAYCKDGNVSGKGTGACSGHGGLLKRS